MGLWRQAGQASLAISPRSLSHAGASYRNTGEAWAAPLSYLREASWSGDRTLPIRDEARRTDSPDQRLHGDGFRAGNAGRCIRLTMRSRQALYHSEQKPWPTALPGLIDAALIKIRASGVQVASGWSDIVLPAVQAVDTSVVAEYAHRPSDVVVQHECNLAYAYELTGWNSSVVGIMSLRLMVLGGRIPSQIPCSNRLRDGSPARRV